MQRSHDLFHDVKQNIHVFNSCDQTNILGYAFQCNSNDFDLLANWQWRNRRGGGAFTGLTKQSYRAGEDKEEGERRGNKGGKKGKEER